MLFCSCVVAFKLRNVCNFRLSSVQLGGPGQVVDCMHVAKKDKIAGDCTNAQTACRKGCVCVRVAFAILASMPGSHGLQLPRAARKGLLKASLSWQCLFGMWCVTSLVKACCLHLAHKAELCVCKPCARATSKHGVTYSAAKQHPPTFQSLVLRPCKRKPLR